VRVPAAESGCSPGPGAAHLRDGSPRSRRTRGRLSRGSPLRAGGPGTVGRGVDTVGLGVAPLGERRVRGCLDRLPGDHRGRESVGRAERARSPQRRHPPRPREREPAVSERAPAGRMIEPARRDILPVSHDEPVSGLHPPVVTGSVAVSTAALGHARGRGDPSSRPRGSWRAWRGLSPGRSCPTSPVVSQWSASRIGRIAALSLPPSSRPKLSLAWRRRDAPAVVHTRASGRASPAAPDSEGRPRSGSFGADAGVPASADCLASADRPSDAFRRLGRVPRSNGEASRGHPP